MPIYSYKCDACGHQSDVLQKISDPPLVECPACRKDSYSKQLTAAGFVLKGGGWYVTDFKDQKKKGESNVKNTETGDTPRKVDSSNEKNRGDKLSPTNNNPEKKSVVANESTVKKTKAKSTHGTEKR